ncbi:MAG: hypothetical protein HQL18_02910 [Candidatus Omnitrophica bacterium]|nr:hypothetical protein [Candidatus Omnitrophota bacterium]
MAVTARQKKTKEVAHKAAVIKRSVSGIGKGMSRSAERVADIILEEDKDRQGQKTKKITTETISMFKDVTKQFVSDIKGVKGRDFVAVGAYSAGKASAVLRRGLRTLLG